MTLTKEDLALYGYIFGASSKQRFGKMTKEKHRLYAHGTLATHLQRMQIDLVDSNDCEWSK